MLHVKMKSTLDDNGSNNNNYINSSKLSKLFYEHLILKSIFAGSASGLFSTVVFQPFDVVKTVLQDPRNASKLGLFNATKIVWRQESFFGFWRGLTPSLARNIPGIAIHISLTQLINSYLTRDSGTSMVKSGLAGFSARCVTVSVLMPFTVLKSRFECGQYHYATITGGLSHICTSEGWKALCRGWLPTILRDAPFSALYFMFFLKFKKMEFFGELHRRKPYYIFGCGFLAGGLASCITQPFDVIKTTQQVSKDKIKFVDAIVFIKQKYGLIGYFNGLSIRVLRRSIVAAMTWTIYDKLI